MKFLNHFPQNKNFSTRKLVFVNEDGLERVSNDNTLLSQVETVAADDYQESPALISGGVEGNNGSFPADTRESMRNRVGNIINQLGDSQIAASVNGDRLSRLFNPERFGGFWQLNLINPEFWWKSTVSPKNIILHQFEEGVGRIGGIDELVGDSPLLGNKFLKATAGNKQINTTLQKLSSGSGHLSDISLGSINVLTEVFNSTHDSLNTINVDQAADYFQKSGYDLTTGKRVEDTGEVFWKRWMRKIPGQRMLYRAKLKQIINRRREGHQEIISELNSLKKKKEMDILACKQKLDTNLSQAENENNTVKLNNIRKTIHLILNHPEAFINAESMFESCEVPASEIFGQNYNVNDVLTMLANGSSYDSEDSIQYLDQATETNQWQMSHFNTIRTLGNLQKRSKAQENFSSTSLEKLETYVNNKYEASDSELDLRNPKLLVNETIMALGSATPGLIKDLHEIMRGGDIYLGATEMFWYLANFFGTGENTNIFDKLPPQLQQQFAQFFLAKRSELEKATISGGVDEKATILWRAKAMKQGEILLSHFDIFINELPKLHIDLRSPNEGVAQEALLKIKNVIDNYDFFKSVMGLNDSETTEFENLIKDLPEVEQGIFKNIQQLSTVVGNLDDIYKNLLESRQKIEAWIDQDPDLVKKRQDEYDKKQALFEELVRTGKTGFEDANVQALVGFGGDGGESGDGDGGMAGLETAYTALRKDLDRLDEFLVKGDDGGAVGKIRKLKAITIDAVPGDIGAAINNITGLTKKLITRRFKELNINSDDDIEALLSGENKPSFDLLARLELGEIASRDILQTANTLLHNEGIKQFSSMNKIEYPAISDLIYVPSKYQTQMTVAGLLNPKKVKDALFVKKDADGSVWYHTETQVFRIIPSKLNNETNQRNMEMWYKSPEEKGYGHFTVAGTNPDILGMLLTTNPENEASKDNPYYGTISSKITTADDYMNYTMAEAV